MRRLVVGVIGHVDHGKTALVRALTGQETDRLSEEQQRGISIALGFAHLAAGPDTLIDLIDMPGHEKFVRTMVAGATGIDAVLLVVSAQEGIKPQTVEHVEIAGLLGLRTALVAVSKCDLVAAEQAQAAADDAADLLRGAGLEPLPSILTSAASGAGVAELRGALESLASARSPSEPSGRAFLPIDRAFTMTGHGPVVTGTLRGGAIAVGDTLELLPARKAVRVRSVQVHGDKLASAAPSQRVAVNLRGAERAELERGMALAEPDAVPLSDWITLAIRSVAGAPPLKNGLRLRALIGTSEVDARLRLLDRDVLDPGERGFAQLHFAAPMAVPVREHAILRLPAPVNTVVGGRVLEVAVRRQKRGVASLLDRLAQLENLAPPEIVAAEVARAGPAGTTLAQLGQVSGLASWKVSERLRALPVEVTRTGLVAPTAALERLHKALPRTLSALPDGLAQTALAALFPSVGSPVLEEALERLVAAGVLHRRGSRYALPAPERDRRRADDAAALSARIEHTLRQAGLTPPLPKAIVVDARSRQAVEWLLRGGSVLRCVDRDKGKELLFHREAMSQARETLAPLLAAEPGLLVTEIAAALGISRKFAMPLLDHLDTTRFTLRDGDRRRLHPSATKAGTHDQTAQEHV
jgi:selenocysteine-specific elongation factor